MSILPRSILGLLILLDPHWAIAGSKPGSTLVAQNTAPTAQTASVSESSSAWGDRTLNGNTFLFPVSFPSAFVTNTAAIQAYGRLLNIPNVPGPTRTHSLQILGATNIFEFGIKFCD